MQIGQAISPWYDVYLESEYGNDIPTGTEEREYPLAILLPVVTQLVFPAEVIQVKLDSTTESTPELEFANKQIKIQDFKLPRWQGVYNDIIQQNTCPLDNILAILSIFKENIVASCGIIGTTPSEARFHSLMSLVDEFDFDKLRDFIARELGMQIVIINGLEHYKFYGSEGTTINYMPSLNLCNDKHISTFDCHQCQ